MLSEHPLENIPETLLDDISYMGLAGHTLLTSVDLATFSRFQHPTKYSNTV